MVNYKPCKDWIRAQFCKNTTAFTTLDDTVYDYNFECWPFDKFGYELWKAPIQGESPFTSRSLPAHYPRIQTDAYSMPYVPQKIEYKDKYSVDYTNETITPIQSKSSRSSKQRSKRNI